MNSAADRPAVVAGIDGSDSALGSARWAAEFAAGHGLPLTLLSAIPKLGWPFARADRAADRGGGSAGDAALAAAETAVRSTHPDLEIHTAAVKGSAATVLAEASESARLLVVGSGGADLRPLGGHTAKIVHRTHCPVVVWRPPVAKRTGKPLPVVVGVDESEASARAIAEAFDIARMLHAPLTAAHMWEIGAAVGMGDLGGLGSMDWELLEQLQAKQRDMMDELVEPLAGKYRNVHVSKVFQDANPARGLTELSREAQLVVVGSRSRGRLTDAVVGSVSQNLVHHAECPVLVIH